MIPVALLSSSLLWFINHLMGRKETQWENILSGALNQGWPLGQAVGGGGLQALLSVTCLTWAAGTSNPVPIDFMSHS